MQAIPLIDAAALFGPDRFGNDWRKDALAESTPLFPISRSWTFRWSQLRDTLRGFGPRGESRYGWTEEAIH
jgi:hypothetical protein